MSTFTSVSLLANLTVKILIIIIYLKLPPPRLNLTPGKNVNYIYSKVQTEPGANLYEMENVYLPGGGVNVPSFAEIEKETMSCLSVHVNALIIVFKLLS